MQAYEIAGFTACVCFVCVCVVVLVVEGGELKTELEDLRQVGCFDEADKQHTMGALDSKASCYVCYVCSVYVPAIVDGGPRHEPVPPLEAP